MKRLLALALSWSLSLSWPASVFAAAAKIEIVRPGLRSGLAPAPGLTNPVQTNLSLTAPSLSGPAALAAAPAAPQLEIPAAAALAEIRATADESEPKPTAYQNLEAASEPLFSPSLFDGANPLPAPDLDLLDTRRILAQAPARSPLSPYVFARLGTILDGWAQKRHERRVMARHIPTEELEMRQSLETAHAHLDAGRPQPALDILRKDFIDRTAQDWFQANPLFAGYQEQGLAYHRRIEADLLAAHERVQRRGGSGALIDEAKAARAQDALLGHPYRRTELQAKDSGHCVLHAFYNAIDASAGFAFPIDPAGFIAYARRTLNKKVAIKDIDPHRAAALERGLGLQLSFDAGEGMAAGAMRRFAQVLGLSMAERGPPKSEQELLGHLRSGREVMLSLRLFHKNHGSALLHHQVYLLGAYPSPSLDRWIYMVQDSGSGATDFYTWRELQDLVRETQVLDLTGPVKTP
ncbi:MAG: hypothetical protein AAB320_03670 [Elusimicrobiota bacterium]